MKRKLAAVFGMVMACAVLTGCPPRPKAPQNTIVVLGDPRNIYEGAITEPDFDLEFFDTSEVYLIGFVEFVEKKATKFADQAAIERENAPTAEGARSSEVTFKVAVNTEKSSVTLSLKAARASLTFTKIPGRNPKVDYVAPGDRGQSELIHFSQSADGDKFSVLMFNEDAEDGKAVSALVFSKSAPKAAPKSESKRFNYVLGPGVKARWPKDQTLKLNICGQRAAEAEADIRAAVNQWSSALKGQLAVRVEVAERYYPITDFRQNCIYFVSNYLATPEKDRGNYGVTFNMTDHGTYNFVDSDVVIFNREFDKPRDAGYSEASLRQLFEVSLVHEYGHVFGLDHQFDGQQSVMSYKMDQTKLQQYDLDAIRELYK